jgi:hypothetical protein
MTEPSRRGFPFAKTVTVLAITFGVGLGMCGLSVIVGGLGAHHNNAMNTFGPVLVVLSVVGLIGMVVSGPLLVITVIVWVIAGAIGSRSGKEPQKPFDDSDGQA